MNSPRVIHHCREASHHLLGLGPSSKNISAQVVNHLFVQEEAYAVQTSAEAMKPNKTVSASDVPSQNPKQHVTGTGLGLLSFRRNEECINILPDLLPERADFFRREPPGTLAMQRLDDLAVGEQTDD